MEEGGKNSLAALTSGINYCHLGFCLVQTISGRGHMNTVMERGAVACDYPVTFALSFGTSFPAEVSQCIQCTAVLSSGCVETSVQVPPLKMLQTYSCDVGCPFDGQGVTTCQSDGQSIECECINL